MSRKLSCPLCGALVFPRHISFSSWFRCPVCREKLCVRPFYFQCVAGASLLIAGLTGYLLGPPKGAWILFVLLFYLPIWFVVGWACRIAIPPPLTPWGTTS